MKTPTNIEVWVNDANFDRACASWHLDGARFHVWFNTFTRELDRAWGTKKLTIFKNSIPKHGEPGYFRTRTLDGDNPGNAAIIKHIFEAINDGAMIAVALDAAKRVCAETEALEAERARQHRIKEAGPRLVAVVKRCQAALRANGAPNCEAMKEANTLLVELGEAA